MDVPHLYLPLEFFYRQSGIRLNNQKHTTQSCKEFFSRHSLV